MNNRPFKLTIHMVASLDGMIAKKDNSVDWFETVDYYEKGITLTGEEMGRYGGERKEDAALTAVDLSTTDSLA